MTGSQVFPPALETGHVMGMRMADRRAEHLFRFVSCMELREALGKRALDEQRLLEIIEEAPVDSIY